MIVVDTSAVVAVLLAKPGIEPLRTRMREDGDLHAPHLIDVELLHALRAMERRSDVTTERASDMLSDFADLAIVRYPHHPLSARIWALRHNVTAYDAAFLALAEALGTPLITCDTRLARSSGHQATIELFARA